VTDAGEQSVSVETLHSIDTRRSDKRCGVLQLFITGTVCQSTLRV